MTRAELEQAIIEIGLALNASNNCVATDLPDAEPDETSWRIDNTKALACLHDLAAQLGFSSDNDL